MSEQPVIEINNLSRRYGAKLALNEVSLEVPQGAVFGLVGENGAGKTTIIKHVLGLLKAQSGTVRVFGLDPVADPVGVLSSVGYLSEEPDLPGWMTVQELLAYSKAFYATWDDTYAQDLQDDFGLSSSTLIKTLSKGQRARAGLITALAFRPKLLLLDEPSSGLDPIVRRDILGAVIRTIADEGRTALFSSHLLTEVESVSDRLAMVQKGKIVFSDTMESIKTTHFKAKLVIPYAFENPPDFSLALDWKGGGREWTALCYGKIRDLEVWAHDAKIRIVSISSASLDEIFLARVGPSASKAKRESSR
jgi:ABC-2 type transport system ATP-binding protein